MLALMLVVIQSRANLGDEEFNCLLVLSKFYSKQTHMHTLRWEGNFRP